MSLQLACILAIVTAAPVTKAAGGSAIGADIAPGLPVAQETQEAATFNVGVPAGDAYNPLSAVVDAARGRAYVYHAGSAERRPVISVVELADGKVLRLIRLAATTLGVGGRLLLAAGGQLLWVEADRGELWAVDPERLTLDSLLIGPTDAALSPDGHTVYVTGPWGLRAYDLAALLAHRTFRWESRVSVALLAANDTHVAALLRGNGAERELVSLDAATGDKTAATGLSDFPNALVAGPDGTWGLTSSGQTSKLRRLDAGLRQTHEVETPFTDGLSYDAPRDRYIVAGFGSTGDGGESVILTFKASDLTPAGERVWQPLGVPNQFVNWGSNRLLAFTRYGPARLEILDPALNSVGRFITGVQIVNLALDDTASRLYVADDHDRVHVLALPDGRRLGTWKGGPPLVLDTTNRRLYVNLEGGVAALDSKGAVIARFPENGYPAADPRRNLVYIVNRGVTMYDRAGRKLGTLPSTFPEPGGFVPNIYAQAVRVNPASGYLAVIINNGVPGSNNGTFLRIYPPKTDTPIVPPGVVSFVTDIAFDPAGRFYVTYSPAKNMEAVQVLDRAGHELRRLAGRSGQVALDPAHGAMYLLTEGLVTQMDPNTLTPVAFWQGPDDLGEMVFSPRRGAFYVYGGSTSAVRVIPLADLTSMDMSPHAGAPATDGYLESLAVTSDSRGQWIIARYSSGLYRTREGKLWERLPVGTLEGYGQVTVAPKGVLFWTGQGSAGADGVWRSTDAGDTWEFLADGLDDLRPAAAVAADRADRAYFANRTDGLLRWDPDRERWDPMPWQPENPGNLGELQLAPGGEELFHTAWTTLRKSTDGGRTWQELEPPGDAGNIIGFSGFYTVTHTLFGLWGDLTLQPMRSTDGGQSWSPLNLNLDLVRDYFPPNLASAGFDVYLLARPYSGDQSVLLRSTDNGDTWEQASAADAKGVQRMAVAPDGALWLGGSVTLRSVDPDQLKWTPLPAATPTTLPGD